MKSGVKEPAAKWYVRHAQAYVEASAGRRIATHSAAAVEAWLGGRGRVDGMAAWQFVQVVEAVRHLLVQVGAPAAGEVDWVFWREGGRTLTADHSTIARSATQPPALPMREGGSGGEPGPGDRLVAVVRERNYSIRTERAYLGWLQRYLRFIGGGDPALAGAAQVKAFLQVLAVCQRRPNFPQKCRSKIPRPVFAVISRLVIDGSPWVAVRAAAAVRPEAAAA